MILKETIETIIETANLKDVISEFITLKKSGVNFKGICPKCNEYKLNVTPGKKIYKCFHCDFKGNNAVSFLMETQKMDYPQALKWLADKYNIEIVEKKEKRSQPLKKTGKIETFRDLQLKQSGLTDADQKATIKIDKDTKKVVNIYESGTLDQFGRIIPGDDMIIWYYNLEDEPVLYQKPKSNKFEHLFRVRWQNPDLHCDSSGKPMKYRSPYGSGSHLYIPQPIRNAYKEGRKIKRLFVQEGEKKADKCCKHGILSVGLMGIHSIAINGRLPQEFELIIKRCQVEEVVFFTDSDFDQIRNNITINERAEQRPYSFFKAVVNFRDYFKTFININIYLELYFGHIILNDNKDKGIDDLLTNTLKENEDQLKNDIEIALNNKESNFAGSYIQLYRITTTPESKIQEYFHINNIEAFAKKHIEILRSLPEFRFNKYKWRIVDDVPQLAQPLMDDETYWEETTWHDAKGKEHKDYKFRYKRAYHFLNNRGFFRIMMADKKYLFCHIVNKIVEIVEPYQIRDYLEQLTEDIASENILEMIYRGGKQYLGPDSMSRLKFTYPHFESSEKNSQCLYFTDVFWKITADKIEEHPITDLQNNIWSDKIRDAKVSLLNKDILEISQLNQEFIDKLPDNKKSLFANKIGNFGITFSAEAKQSHFIQFLLNTSDFYWFKYKDIKTRKSLNEDGRSLDEIFETNLHMVSKITAIGYLLHKYRDRSCEKAVIGMDGKNSEVGESNGRTGKSLLGIALSHMLPQVYIPGKSKDIANDPFIFEQVTEKTDNIFIDDTRANFDFEFLFPVITGTITVNIKGQKKFNLPTNFVPKIYLTTNHAINGRSGSFKDRQAFICFSDYYSDNHKPVDDFGINFFDEWEQDQWNLFYNFMGFCLKTYFKYGIVSPPMEIVEKRRLRQYIGDDFITWANDYYGTSDDDSPDNIYGSNINQQIPRTEIFNNFFEKCPSQRKWVTAKNFKNKLRAWCEYRELTFNPHPDKEKTGKDNKSGGVEYITIGNIHFINL